MSRRYRVRLYNLLAVQKKWLSINFNVISAVVFSDQTIALKLETLHNYNNKLIMKRDLSYIGSSNYLKN